MNVRPLSDYPIHPPAVWHPLTPLYDFGCSLLGFGRRFREWIVTHADISGASRALDVGCGTGVLTRILAERYPQTRWWGVDPDRAAAEIAAQRALANQCVVIARGERLPFHDASVDLVVSSLAFHHVPDRWKGEWLAEVDRVLAPGGSFLLVDFDNHRRWWVPPSFRSGQPLPEWLTAAGFSAEWIASRQLVQIYRARPNATRRGADA